MSQSTKFLVSTIQGFPPGDDQFLVVQLSLSSVIPSLLVKNVPLMLLWRNNTTKRTMWVGCFANRSIKHEERKRIKAKRHEYSQNVYTWRRKGSKEKIKAKTHAVFQVLHAWVTWYWSSVPGHLLSLPWGKRMKSVAQPGGRGKRGRALDSWDDIPLHKQQQFFVSSFFV